MSAQAVETPSQEPPHQHLQLFHTGTPPQLTSDELAEIDERPVPEDERQERLF